VRILLDTHIFFWLHTSPEHLDEHLDLVRDEANELLVSAASSWEIAIKCALGRLDLPETPQRYVPGRIARLDATPVAIEHRHTLGVADLPDIHRDPFDRLLLAQAHVLRMPLLTADATLDSYPVDTVLVAN
jgi:PIN domain nuclease of toxin-antitoxin system